MEGQKKTFPFTLESVQVEYAHCQHQLVGSGDFGLEIVRCQNCRKFTQLTSKVETTRVKTPLTATEA